MKSVLLNTLVAGSIFGIMSIVYACQPVKTNDELQEPQVVINNAEYKLVKTSCVDTCLAVVESGKTKIYVEYALDDGSVKFLDIDEVLQNDVVVNAYVDSSEISKINVSIVKSSDI